ncbi:hypothetical protein B5M42_016365, partial [Paenibacillus athensensis]|nr:hypothetical protein [Paenibacillus athensensis]
MSKDGYLLIAYATLSGNTGNFYLQAFDSSNGSLIGESKFFSATTGNSSSLSTAELRGIYLYQDGKIFVKGFDSNHGNWTRILEGPALSRAKKEAINTFGQLYSPAQQAQNAEFAYSVNFKGTDNYYPVETAGFSFRMKDNQNMYRVEQDIYHIRLIAYDNGNRTVLQESAYGLANDTFYTVKIKANGDRIKVYVNGAPMIDVRDSRMTAAGSYGPYSTKDNVEFKAISMTVYPGTQLLNNVIVVGQPIQYSTTYSDPETDPAVPVKAKWTFSNQQPYVFLDSGDGYSDTAPTNSYSNQVVTSPNPVLNKVGIYKVDYQIPDDPSPTGYSYADGVFVGYSQYSDPYSQMVKVIRMPVARFTITKNANNTLSPNDQSFDPDRWLSPVQYQSSYQANRGIFDRKWKYTAPDGTTAFGFPTNPSHTGRYTVSEVVMQEDGVWSDWYDQTVDVTVAVPNNPPTAVLTYPTGTQASPSFSNTTEPVVTWNQTDTDANTIFAAYQVLLKDEAGNIVIDSGIISQGTANMTQQWKVPLALIPGAKYQFQVRVSDGTAWSAWSNIGWLITNRPPTATMLVPGGTQANPTVFNSVRPTLQWNQSDPDVGTQFSYFQIQITNETNTVIILDSGQYYQGSWASIGSWTVNQDLPAGQKLQVWVRVFDGYVWSSYSPKTWMYINRAPTGTIAIQPSTVYQNDDVTVTIVPTDPDGDVVNIQVERSMNGGTYQTIYTVSAIPSGTTKAFMMLDVPQSSYTLRLTVTDPM